MRSGEAAQRAEDNFKPLPLDAQFAYDRKYSEVFDGKSPEQIAEKIDRMRNLSIADLKGIKVYVTNRFHVSQLEAEDAVQTANHANHTARNLRAKEHEFRKLISDMNDRLVRETVDHISFFMGSDDFNERCRNMGNQMLSEMYDQNE